MNDVLTVPVAIKQLRQIKNILEVYFPKADFKYSNDQL